MIPDYVLKVKEEYIRKGFWKNATVFDLWEKNALDFPHEEAVVDYKNRLTWAQAKLWIDRLSLGLLELGFRKNEVLVIQLPNSVELSLLRVACEKAGILSLPVLRTMRHKELEYILHFTKAAGIVIPWQYRGFDYFEMVQEIRHSSPALRAILVSSDKVPDGTISINDIIRQPKGIGYPTG